MEYVTRFYCPCPRSGKENFVEVHFFRDEAPADRLEFWGATLSLPATYEVQITSVFRNGKIWEDYPDLIEEEIYSHDWTKINNRHKRA